MLKEFALWALRKRRPWRVSGTSMAPVYQEGDLVLVDPQGQAQVGTAIVAQHPFKNIEVIKYVHAIDPDGYLVLRSPSGDDSRQFGRVAPQTVRGTVTYNWKRRPQP